LDALLSPEGGLAGLALGSFLAATLVPLPSEAALFAYLKLHPQGTVAAIAVATIANTAGGMTSYLLGRLLPERTQERLAPRENWKAQRALAWLRRYGAGATFFAWLPIVGDALCIAAGWLRLSWPVALGFMAAGRLARYLAVLAL
jgi:membrane protein YqaA with SNARE-associated domain